MASDFNKILFLDEKTGRDRNNWQVDNFRNALSDTGVFDLG